MSGKPANPTFAQDGCRVASFPVRRVVCWLVLVALSAAVVSCTPSTEELENTPFVENITSLPPAMTPAVKEVIPAITVSPEETIDNTPHPSVPTSTTPHVDQESEQFSIHLQWGTIDTSQGEPQLPDSLRIDTFASGETGYYIVQFDDVILPEWRTALETAGAEIMGYVPNNAFLVRIFDVESIELSAVEHVQWVGIYQPAYRISPELINSSDERMILTIMTFPGVGLEQFTSQLKDLGGDVIASFETDLAGTVRVEIDSSYIEQVAHYNGVLWIERWIEPELSITTP